MRLSWDVGDVFRQTKISIYENVLALVGFTPFFFLGKPWQSTIFCWGKTWCTHPNFIVFYIVPRFLGQFPMGLPTVLVTFSMVYPAFFGIFSGFSWFFMNFTNLSMGLPWFFMGLPWFSQVFHGFY